MAYNKPAVWVYQELINAGGAANITPDLPACIVGPANNVVKIDFDDEVDKGRSFAGTIATIDESAGVNWGIEVNSDSATPGQVIVDTSVVATFENPLVATYREDDGVWAGSVVPVGINLIGTQGSNSPTQPVPWDASRAHVRVGDTIVIGTAPETVTFVTEVSDDNIKVAATIVDGTYSFDIYSKFTTSVTRPEWDTTNKHLVVGNLDSVTFPGGFTPVDLATNDGYVYRVEKEIKGFGDELGIYIGYKASRTDLIGRILTINDVVDLENQLGAADPIENPLCFGISIALANSGGAPIHGIAIDQDAATDLIAYTGALDLAEGQLLYSMVPLTTDVSIQAAFKSHVNAMSQPSSGNWRVALFNQEIPDVFYVLGRPDGGDREGTNIPANTIMATASGTSILLSEGDVGTTTAGDDIFIYTQVAGQPVVIEEAEVSDASGSLIVTSAAITAQGEVFVYVSRDANRQEQAQAVADQSKAWVDRRVINFPGEVRVNTDVEGLVVPGYYLLCGVAGFISGAPAQQGITNLTFAGIAGLQHGNFYFTEPQLNLMAEFGTMLFVQDSQETTPYCRHGLTTDVSILEYREILKVKNWDFVSYYYKNILSPYIGTWNITPDTLQTIRQTVNSGIEQLKNRKLPKIGPPLLEGTIQKLEQNPNSRDAIDLEIAIEIVSPNNYMNVYLQI